MRLDLQVAEEAEKLATQLSSCWDYGPDGCREVDTAR